MKTASGIELPDFEFESDNTYIKICVVTARGIHLWRSARKRADGSYESAQKTGGSRCTFRGKSLGASDFPAGAILVTREIVETQIMLPDTEEGRACEERLMEKYE